MKRAPLAAVALAVAMAAQACDTFVRHAPKGPPPSAAVVRAVCTSELGGPKARVRVWRDDHGQVTVLELFPDPNAKARASEALYDTRGREQLRLPPIDDPGSPQALEADRRRDTVIEDSRRGETLSCGAPDGGV